jgi:hypothetical protein
VYVELVDARRHQQKRLLVDLGGQRLVFDELEQLVLKHHGTFGGRDVFAHLKQTFVRHGHMALLQVVHQVLHALGNAFALGFNGLFLCLCIQGQEIAGRGGCHPLLDREADTAFGLFV